MSIVVTGIVEESTKKIAMQPECIPEGCIPSVAVAVSGGCLPKGPCLSKGGMLSGGVCVCLGVVCPQGVYTSPIDRITYVCENITFPQILLWPGKISV